MSTYATSQVVPTDALTQWQIHAIKAVLECSLLPANWNTYGSPAPTPVSVNSAIDLVRSVGFEYLPAPDVVAVAGGGIQLQWVAGRRELELEVLPDGTVEFLKTQDGDPLDEGSVKGSAHVDSLLTWLTAV